MKKLVSLLFLTSILCSNHVFSNVHDKELQTIDREYEETIRSVLLYPTTSSLKDALTPPIVQLNDNRSLLLSFDEMGSDVQNYYVRILNCNYDWTLSNLNSIMFLTDYNEYQIFDRTASYNTRIPYTHYKFIVPRTKISGNFIVMVYREGDDQDIVLTRRFMVYETLVTIAPQIKFPVSNNERNTGQQIDFNLTYSSSIINPMERLQVVIRQNYQWNTAISDLKPVFMRDDIRTYEYTFFNNENVFKGVNEFRFFDLRSIRANGMNVAKIVSTTTNNDVLLAYDKTRKGTTYGTSIDINGMYAPEQYETKGYETDPDYANVTFTLEIKPAEVPGRIFVIGGLTNWNLNKNFEMKWDEEYKVYTCTTLLKQGYYNYQYVFIPTETNQPDYTWLEGSFSTTQNAYDFITYYRAPTGMWDRIVGYRSVDYLGR